MSINYPTFSDKEIVPPEKLNSFVTAIEAKFTAGIGAAEIQWPLTAGGNLDMGTYDIVDGGRIMQVVNARSYATLAAALAAAGTAGSGYVVYIPPNTTIQADGEDFLGTEAAIIGSGPTSVLKMSDTPAGDYMLQNSVSGAGSRFLIANLTLDGNTSAGTSKVGLQINYASRLLIHNVIFKDWSGPALKLTSTGGDANACQDVQITDCQFSGGAEQHILADSLQDAVIKGCTSSNCDEIAFDFTPSSATAPMRRISIVENSFRTCDEEHIRIVGGGGTINALWANIIVSKNNIDGTGQDAATSCIVAGSASNVLQYVNVSDNVIFNTVDKGIDMVAEFGSVASNVVDGTNDSAIALNASENLAVHGNMCSGTYGINAFSVVDCLIYGNHVPESANGLVIPNAPSGFQYGNYSRVWDGPMTGYCNLTTLTVVNAATGSGCSVTLPANSLRTGNVIKLRANAQDSGNDNGGTASLRVGGDTVGYVNLHGADGADYAMEATVVITLGGAAGTAEAASMGMTGGTDNESNPRDYALTGLDCSAAVVCDVYINNGTNKGDAICSGLFVYIDRMEVQS